jgi:RNA polymerase primary sigma factor
MEAIGLKFSDELLTAEQEVELAKAIEVGVLAAELRRSDDFGDATAEELIMLERLGHSAVGRFVVTNVRLVAMVSNREAIRSGLPEDEVFQEGCLGLLEAIRRFDYRRGHKFATYALHWIRAYTQALTANRGGELNLPASRAVRARRLLGTEAELRQRLGREVSTEELAAAVGKSPNWVAEMLSHRFTQSLEEETLGDLEPADLSAEVAFESVLRAQIPGREVLTYLDAQERRVIELRFGFSGGGVHSYSATARILDISVSRVRRIERRALAELRGVYPQQASVHL